MILLTSTKFLKENFAISDNVEEKYLLSSMRESQEIGLQSIIGTKLYNKLLTLVEKNEIGEDSNKAYKDLLNLCQYYLGYKTISNLCMTTNFKVNNIGVNQTTDDRVNVTTLKDTLQIQQFYEDKADFYNERIIDYCKKNYKDVKEVTECSWFDIHSNLYSASSCGLFLGGARGRRIKRY